jgi:menaquinone-specific isochorismate synthase
MKTTFQDHLLAELNKQLHSSSREFIRIEIPIDPIDPFVWLHNQTDDIKCYWADRGKTFRSAGLGITDTINATTRSPIKQTLETIQQKLHHLPDAVRYYGGFSFSGECEENWKSYGTARFIIPRFELVQKKEAMTFVVNLQKTDLNQTTRSELVEQIRNLRFDPTTTYADAPKPLNRNDFPDKQNWLNLLNQHLNWNDQTHLQKVVLARQSLFEFNRTIRPEALLKHLANITPNCYHFNFQLSSHHGFIGATPEQLCRVHENKIQTEAIAGTTGRGKGSVDERLGQALLKSEKNRMEHQCVVDEINSRLQPFCSSLAVTKPCHLFKLKFNQHLRTCFEGELHHQTSTTDIISSLHPTPAVGGLPRDKALTQIRQIEPFSRGWYAAPVGWIEKNSCEFAVAIRSALVHNTSLSVYAGAGIVPDSDYDDEWNEIETKIMNFLSVFNTGT